MKPFQVGRRISFMRRRSFFGVGLWMGIGTRAPCASAGDAIKFQCIQKMIEALFPDDLRGVRSLGVMYLRDHPAEGRSAELLSCKLGLPSLGAQDMPALRGAIARRRAEDFAAADMVTLDGWVFARTEARLFALVALI